MSNAMEGMKNMGGKKLVYLLNDTCKCHVLNKKCQIWRKDFKRHNVRN